MRTYVYLNERKESNLLASVDMEVVPRGSYIINGVAYINKSQPEFFITSTSLQTSLGMTHAVNWVNLIVEKVDP
jgi:hypothetical protein